MKQYLEVLEKVLIEGKSKPDRTGVGTLDYCRGVQMQFNLQEGYPLVTTKRIIWKSIVGELLFFLRNQTNNKWLTDRGIGIWQPWAREDGSLGRIYSSQFRDFGAKLLTNNDGMAEWCFGIDQIKLIIENLKKDPFSRRHKITLINPKDLLIDEDSSYKPVLNCCHDSVTFSIEPNENEEPEYLNLNFTMRSTDGFIGLPYNLASYALLCHLVAKQLDLKPGYLTYQCTGSIHIYKNHIPQVLKQLKREPRQLPILQVDGLPDLINMKWQKNLGYSDVCKKYFYEDNNLDINLGDFEITTSSGRKRLWKDESDIYTPLATLYNYAPHSFIKAPVAV